jgi:UDP-glucose 4-epimerase
MHTILVTGGLGFIGSETVIALIQAGYEPIVVDDLYNAKEAVLDRIETITHVRPVFYKVDVTKKKETEAVFKAHKSMRSSILRAIKRLGSRFISRLSIIRIILAAPSTFSM